MFFHMDVIEKIREKYKIPKGWKTYYIPDWIFEKLFSGKPETQIEYSILKFQKEIDKWNDCEHYGAYRGEYFMVLSIQAHEGVSIDDTFLFTTNKDRFFKEFLYKLETPEPEFILKEGLYIPVLGMNGWILSLLPLNETDPPILNDELFNKTTKEINEFTKREEIYVNMKSDYKRGILLYGPPGNGKTSFIKYFLYHRKDTLSIICDAKNEEQLDFINRIICRRDIKNMLKIIVMEDIDGINPNCRSKILNFLDGIIPVHKTIFIATTNFPHHLDPALMNRPSRFDSVVYIDEPDRNSREKLLKRFFPKMKKDELEKCVQESNELSGAYFKEIYLFGALNDMTPLDTIKELKHRIETFMR